MAAFTWTDDTPYIVEAIKQIGNEMNYKAGTRVFEKDAKFSDFEGWQYAPEITAQSAILQRAQTLKEFRTLPARLPS